MTDKILIDSYVVEQALEALDEIAWSNNTRQQSDRADDARIVLRAAIEQAQPPRQPLTDDEIKDILKPLTLTVPYRWRDIVNAIERAHGIGG